jgi:hypothetical protein
LRSFGGSCFGGQAIQAFDCGFGDFVRKSAVGFAGLNL